MSVLVLSEVNLAYDQHSVVNNVSLTLENGEIACLLGPSGGRACSASPAFRTCTYCLDTYLVSHPPPSLQPHAVLRRARGGVDRPRLQGVRAARLPRGRAEERQPGVCRVQEERIIISARILM